MRLALVRGYDDDLRTQLAYGAVQRRARQWGAARETLESAGRTFDAIGARVWAGRSRAELARVGGRPPSSGALSATERRVAELVAEGLQTKPVAAALFVSPKTVEGHLTHIFGKLDVHSRTELAHRLGDGFSPRAAPPPPSPPADVPPAPA